MSDTNSGLSRRTLAKGAAWAVPAVAVAAEAPAYAVSQGPLTFEGGACKLPGSSHPIYKGYVFELRANNVLGKNPLATMTVITDVKVQGISYDFSVVPVTSYSCTCGPCGSVIAAKQFCTPDGVTGQRILIWTADAPNSSNTAFEVTYQRYECTGTTGTTCTAFGALTTISSGTLSTPPAQGSTCTIKDYEQHVPASAPARMSATTMTTPPEVTTTTTTTTPPEVTTTTTTTPPKVTTTTTTAS